MAGLCQITVGSYEDIERYDDEAFTAISLGQLKQICNALALPLAKLISSSSYSEQYVGSSKLTSAARNPRKWRLAAGRSVSEVANAVGYEVKAIELIEEDSSKLDDFCLEMLAALARSLRVSLDEILG